jgi:hypothetical protein
MVPAFGRSKLLLCRGSSLERDSFYFGEIKHVGGTLNIQTDGIAVRIKIDNQPVQSVLPNYR